MVDYMESYKSWLEADYIDSETKSELMDINGNDSEIKERFYKELEFGTGGLRGIMGAGTNRMNIYTVGRATQGIADYIKKNTSDGNIRGVAIAYDSRNMSSDFAKRSALVLCANGIKAYVFDSLRPTPELSFAVRHLGCIAGIVITASHNPPEYNGYKVYWEDGAQVTSPKDKEIINSVNAVNIPDVKIMDFDKAVEAGLYVTIGKEIDDEYIKNVKSQALNSYIVKSVADSIKIVYTPLHGTGNKPVRRVLSEIGFKNVYVVPEQELPDGNFPTVGYPNPEDPKAFTLAVKLAKEVGADVIIGTDPDADRVGVLVKNSNGDYTILNGNMTGSLLTNYVLSQRKEKAILPSNGAVIKTIVTTEMIRPIAKDYGVKVFDVLTGFKYIGEKIKEFEKSGEYSFIFGFEESYGCLSGTYARDKDSVVASMLIAELTAFYKSQGKTLYDGLEELYKKYGFYREGITSITLKGIEGTERIGFIMDTLRSEPPKDFCGTGVKWIKDYTKDNFKNVITGEEEKNSLPFSNVLYYTLENDDWVCVRPSGTEPKIKIYYGVKETTEEKAKNRIDDMANYVKKLIDEI